MSTLIANENLTSQLGGTVFTLPNPIEKGVQLNYNGLEYFDFTITGTNEITTVDTLDAGTGYYLRFDYLTPGGSIAADGLTAQDIRDLLTRQQNDVLPDLGDDEFLDFVNWLNQESYMYLYGVNPEDYIVTQTINVVSGTSTYSISTSLDNIRVLGAGLFEEDKDYPLPQTGYNSQIKGAYIAGDNIILTPTPTKAETMTFRYIPESTILTDMTDKTVLSQKYTQYVKDMINISFYEWSKDQREVGSSQRVIDSFNKFIKRIQKQPNVFII